MTLKARLSFVVTFVLTAAAALLPSCSWANLDTIIIDQGDSAFKNNNKFILIDMPMPH